MRKSPKSTRKKTRVSFWRAHRYSLGSEKRHSEAYFGPQRDFWWNADYLELLAERWRLHEVKSLAVDVGCGMGHWSCSLYRHFGRGAKLICFDREPTWPLRAVERFAQFYGSRGEAGPYGVMGDVAWLPFPDDAADLVTCQTLLVHVPDPLKAVQEMERVTKPGGLVICAEPNNLFGAITVDSVASSFPTEDLITNFEFSLRYQRGKAALGLGDNSIGDLVPGIFAQIGFEDIRVYLSDKTNPLLPPYSSEEQKTLLEQEVDWRRSRSGPWDRDELNSYVSAGGGSSPLVERYLRLARRRANLKRNTISNERYYDGGAAVMYVVSGRKAVSSKR
jgi:SAM-dependent methyltransferase